MAENIEFRKISDKEMDNLLARASEIREVPLIKATYQAANRITCNELQLMTEEEAVTVRALMTYIIYRQQVGEAMSSAELQKRFGVSDLETLRRQDLDDVVAFLVERLDSL